jgi:uncharacterized protein (TIGR02217 family)
VAVDGFHDVLFPARIAMESSSGNGWRTVVQEASSGDEVRVARWSQLRMRSRIAFNNLSLTHIRTVQHFHAARMGRRYTFRYLDPNDHRMDDELGSASILHTNSAFEDSGGATIFYTAAGGETTTQLTKPYGDSANVIFRKITKPVDASTFPTLALDTLTSLGAPKTITIPAFTIYLDTGGGPTALANGTDYVMPYDTGLIDWTAGSAPNGALGSGDIVSAKGWFHVHARLDSDLPEIASLLSYDAEDRIDASNWPDLEIVEVRG